MRRLAPIDVVRNVSLRLMALVKTGSMGLSLFVEIGPNSMARYRYSISSTLRKDHSHHDYTWLASQTTVMIS